MADVTEPRPTWRSGFQRLGVRRVADTPLSGRPLAEDERP